MKLPDFKVEQWMNDHEMDAVYNLTDTCVKALSLQELLSLETIDESSLILDYGQITGSKHVKEAILSFYQSGTIDQVTTCHGCLEANHLVMSTLLEPKDHVITCVPGYQQFVDLPRSMGCRVSTVTLDEAHGWSCDVNRVKDQIGSATKMIILNNPNNPTGTHFSDAFLYELARFCKDKNIYILCDEVYRSSERETSISDIYEYGISTGSLSKVLALAGLRFGWIKGNEEVIHAVNVRRDYTMISTGPLVEQLAFIAMKHKDEWLERSTSIIQKNKAIIRSWLKTEKRFHVQLPDTGTVSFLKYDFNMPSEQLAETLLKETGVFFVPGSCFNCEYHLRLGLGQDPEQMEKGLKLMSRWIDLRLHS